MRRLLVIICLVGLVLASLGVGILAADWPFWQRAWSWHVAGGGEPAHMPGVWRALGRGEGEPLGPLPSGAAEQAALLRLAQAHATQALLVSRGDTPLAEHYGRGRDADSPLQGGSLTELLVLALYGQQRLSGPDLLDQPVGRVLSEWRGEPRGEITPRQLFWQLSGLQALPWSPFNPFSDRARLAFGPNFDRAALGFPSAYPPGSHFEATPANAQVLGAVIARARGERLVELAERELWVPLGAGQATVALDRLAGDMAAHCCLVARARDWLRLARLLADDGRVGPRQLWPAGFVADIAAASPVHPGYGLGVVVTRGGGGETLLWAQSAGRLLLAVPEHHLAAVWFSDSELDGTARRQLLAALGL